MDHESDTKWIPEEDISRSRAQKSDEVVILNERRRLSLQEIDKARFSYGHPSCLIPSYLFEPFS